MPEFLTDFITKPAEPLFGVVMSVLLWLIYRSLEEVKTALVTAALAQQVLSNTATSIVTALEGVGDNVERGSEASTEVVRMLERSTTAQTERHQSNLELLKMVLQAVNHRGRT